MLRQPRRCASGAAMRRGGRARPVRLSHHILPSNYRFLQMMSMNQVSGVRRFLPMGCRARCRACRFTNE
jgi:hypothetical protein